MDDQFKLIVMGGSWGGIQASLAILKNLPADFKIPIVLVLHRLKYFDSEIDVVYGKRLNLKVTEVDDKATIESGYVYIAPANYHVLLERDNTFSLDSSELENYSRPSIDVTFSSAAEIYCKNVLGILLSGANKDGSLGLKSIVDKGGKAIVQDPKEAEIDTMPISAINSVPNCEVLTLTEIQNFLFHLNDCQTSN
jgi:two-component system chemotaxis response regulator CheB